MECTAKNIRELSRQVFLQDKALEEEYEKVKEEIFKAAKNGNRNTIFKTMHADVKKLCLLLEHDGFSCTPYNTDFDAYTNICIGWWDNDKD